MIWSKIIEYFIAFYKAFVAGFGLIVVFAVALTCQSKLRVLNYSHMVNIHTPCIVLIFSVRFIY